jgi:NADH-quinone oxidoreductase subunit L
VTGWVAIASVMAAAPAAVALVGLLLPPASRRIAGTLGVAGALVALVAAVALAAHDAPVRHSWHLVDVGTLPVSVTVQVSQAAALVAVAVGVVALAVQLYSLAYLDPDDRYAPYAAQVSLFTAAMLVVVVAGDLIMLLVGWEVMGICSYLLIAHDRTLPEAPGAAVKAFLVTRVGDVGFLLGIALLGISAGTFQIDDVLTTALPHGRLTLATLLLLGGVFGKSAQFPLHTWLPDAMAGPTPISALIHAATMVAAGVYVVTRLFPLFTAAPATLAVLGVSASITMLLGALAATSQDDIKRVLAWSTVSQIGYMAGALAVGSSSAALFHLLTHAAFKALLFLAAGCVIHAVGSNSMTVMGGLRRALPATFTAFTVGLLALAGIPPLSGFFSKDTVLSAAFEARDGSGPAASWVAWLVWLTGIATALVTAAYCARLWLRTFFGSPRGDAEPHHTPALMLWPVLVLAVPAALLGFAGLGSGLAGRLGAEHLFQVDASTWVALAAVLVGVAGGWWAWQRDTAADPALVLGRARPVLAQAFYLDNVQDALVTRPVQALARVVRRGDAGLVDGAVEGVGRGGTGAARVLLGWHRAPVSRALSATLGGLLLLAVALLLTTAVNW